MCVRYSGGNKISSYNSGWHANHHCKMRSRSPQSTPRTYCIAAMVEPSQRPGNQKVCKTAGCNYSFWAPDYERCVARNMLSNSAAGNHKPQTSVKLEVAITVLSSWWLAVRRSKRVEQLINIGIITSNRRLHLVGYFYMICTMMHGTMNIKCIYNVIYHQSI